MNWIQMWWQGWPHRVQDARRAAEAQCIPESHEDKVIPDLIQEIIDDAAMLSEGVHYALVDSYCVSRTRATGRMYVRITLSIGGTGQKVNAFIPVLPSQEAIIKLTMPNIARKVAKISLRYRKYLDKNYPVVNILEIDPNVKSCSI